MYRRAHLAYLMAMTLAWLSYDVAEDRAETARFNLMGAGWRDAVMHEGRVLALPRAILVKELMNGETADFVHAEATLRLIDADARPQRLFVVIGAEHYAG